MSMKNFYTVLAATLMSSSLFAGGSCSELKVDFTFYGAKDKSYVVTKNTFKDIKVTSNGNLEGSSVEIDLMSIDTSADLSNGKSKWPMAMANVRNNNTKNSFYKKFTKGDGKAVAKVVKVNGDSVDVEITANDVIQKVTMSTKTEGDKTVASGKLDVSKFSSPAWTSFTKICKGFHKGKSWAEIDLNFSVPSSCK